MQAHHQGVTMNNKIVKSALGACLLAVSALGVAATDPSSVPDRDQRMDQALRDYRAAHPNDRPGRFARAENSVKRGAHRAANAVKKGAHKTGAALHRTGQKIEGKTE
jgi:hypothetical protein